MSQSITMTPARWQRLQALFDEALAFDPAARAGFVASACGDDASLREQLLSLIMASNSDDQSATRVDQRFAATMMRDTELQAGHIVGRYKIIRLLGRGGMGAVYLAERADKEFEQRVAIKVVADGELSSRIMARLRSERQILANLNHPNIARLFDGGATSDGTPYLAMEYVDGRRIDHYCQEQKLTFQQRLVLFQGVCAAVQYAHQQLVIHRDIKASNILVTNDGIPKLLDFGIAKLLDPNIATQSVALTRVYERVLTPSNASPEQVRGEQVGTVSDVYALGVLLYELLTGLPPYNVNGLSFEQIEALICEHAPPRPSSAVVAASKLEIPTADAALAKPLQGDLDTIVLKAMHKEPQRRYGSAVAFADDIENYLNNKPISARPDSLQYRAGKYWRRNRWALSSAAVVVLAVAGLTILYMWKLAIERDHAAVEAIKAKQVAEFLAEMFHSVDPSEAQGRQMTAMDMLDRGAERIESQLVDQPRVRADLSSVIGISYRSLGAYERAQPLLENALKLQRETGLSDTREYARTLSEFANLKRIRGDFTGAKQAFEEALALQRIHGTELDIVATMTNLGAAYGERKRYQEAMALQQEAMSIVRRAGAEDKVIATEVMNNLAVVLQDLKEFDRAEPLLRRSIEIRERISGERHPMTQVSKMNLALFLRTTGHYQESVRLLEQLLPVRREVLGATHPNVGNLLAQIGGVLSLMGECDRADANLRAALSIIEAKLGREHTRYSALIRSLGVNEMVRGNYRTAEQYLRSARVIEIKNFGSDDPQIYRTNVMIARSLRGQGKEHEAGELLESAFAYFEKNSQAEKGRLLLEMGRLRMAQNRWQEARVLFVRDIADFEAIGGPEDPATIGPLQGVAQVALHANDFDTAISYSRRALDTARKKTPDARSDIAVAKSIYGAALLGAGQLEVSAPLIKESYETLAAMRSASDPIVRAAQDRLRTLEAIIDSPSKSAAHPATTP